MFTLGEIKQKIATTNGEIDNDLFLINLLDRTFTLQAQPLYLTYPPLREEREGVYLYWLPSTFQRWWYKRNVILIPSMIFSSLF